MTTVPSLTLGQCHNDLEAAVAQDVLDQLNTTRDRGA